MEKKNIAIIGTGISGLTAAYMLHRTHEITVFEANGYIGGHTNTIEVEENGSIIPVDTGFIVHNEKTYPNFIRLMNELGVKVQPTEMSFSVKDEVHGLEYNGGSLNKMFAQRRNLIRPSFYRMIKDIMRFNREARDLLESGKDSITLGDYLKDGGYSREFIEQYLIPMGAAIWSTVPEDMLLFPALNYIRFFMNHGLLDLKDRPQWKTIVGGSKQYVDKMTAGFLDRIYLNSPVVSVRRLPSHVEITVEGKRPQHFDEVIIAAHSNQALKMLVDPSPIETKLLGAIPYQENIAVLHTDTTLLPTRKLAWASWNYHIAREQSGRVALTYNMNILQRLNTNKVYNVTLNRYDEINPDNIIRVIRYEHPLFTSEGIAAQQQKHLVNGVNRTWFCGAYWGNGFHEDGVVSALDVVESLKESL